MQGVNRVILLGRVGKDAELRFAADGKAVTTFSVATHLTRLLEEGKREVETEWHRAVAFGRTGENVAPFLTRGTPVYVEGRMRHNRWTDKEGHARQSSEIWVDRVQILPRRDSPAPTPAPAREMEQRDEEGAELPF